MSDDDLKFDVKIGCIHHTLNLTSDKSVKEVPEMEKAVKKSRALAAHFSRSAKSRATLKEIQENAKVVPPKRVIIGTENRCFFRHAEAKRLLELKPHLSVMFSLPL